MTSESGAIIKWRANSRNIGIERLEFDDEAEAIGEAVSWGEHYYSTWMDAWISLNRQTARDLESAQSRHAIVQRLLKDKPKEIKS